MMLDRQHSLAVDWPMVTLGDVASDLTVGHVGPMANEYISVGVPFLRSLNVAPFEIKRDGMLAISNEFHARLRKSVLRPGDVVVVRTGKPGMCAVIPDWLPEANCSDLVIIRPGPHLRPWFACYMINSTATDHVAANIVGAVQQHFNVGAARRIAFRLPPLAEQDRILGVLRALDAKIDLNRTMNETLEAVARAIFRDWFVAFGPTRAKIEGGAPYLTPEVWSLLPDALGDDGLPQGWRASTVGKEFSVVMGQSPPGDTYTADPCGLPFYQGKTDFTHRFPERRIYCTAPTRRASAGDALISVRAPVGALNMAREECCLGRGVAALRHRSGNRGFTYYTAMALQPLLAVFEDNGTVFGAINKDALNGLPVTAPPAPLVEAFERFVAPMDDRIAANADENRALASFRDLLLPRLMSGEIRVREAEAMAEAAQ